MTVANPTTSATAAAPLPELQLDLVGMTCASCANRIERGLNKVPGVEATVNYATERATVRVAPDSDGQLDASVLIAAVESPTAHREAETAKAHRG